MEKRRKVALDAAIYKRPAEGSPLSADPHFVARVRQCGLGCGNTFTTTAGYRYACENCRGRLRKLKPDQLPCRVSFRLQSTDRTRD